jgi:RHS repeat-associated protein
MQRFRSALFTLVGVSLVAGIASYVPPTEAKAYSAPPPATQPDKSVPGKDLQVAAKPSNDLAAAAALKETPRPTWPSASDATVLMPTSATALGSGKPSATTFVRSGDSPVSIGQVRSVAAAKYVAQPKSVRVEVFDQARGEQLGVKGLALRMMRADGSQAAARVQVKVDYSSFRYAYGADWASRLRLVQLQCSSETSCERSAVVPNGVNDGAAGTYTADVQVTGGQSAFALLAAPSGPNGSYAATTLAPASSWNVGLQTGDFTWSYPFRMPPGTSGPRPELSIGYSSGSVDGQTASTNNQPSWLGQGHSLDSGFVERKYVSCADDMGSGANNITKTGDLCWRSDNATLSLGSHSSELLWDDAANKWRLRKDDGSRIERLTGASNGARNGEHWRLTTSDGTQYYFGLNPPANGTTPTNSLLTVPVFGNNAGEPCYQTTFAASYCQQAWRWNLDRVVDRSGNVMTYRYVKETNNYGRNNNTGVSTYDRASYLASIEYGERVGADTGVPPARVIFGVSERCLPSGSITCAPEQLTAANASYWPDVPFDQICASATTCPNQTSPSFFTRKRLYTLYTQVLTPAGAAQTVDSWSFTQTFPDPGDSTAKALWLANIQHRGMVGGQYTDPAVTFTGVSKPNRVDGFTGGAFPMNKWRISDVKTESGANIVVAYMPAQCSSTSKPADPATNTMRCFPVYWTVEGGSAPTLHYFHKYVVSTVTENDLVAGSPYRQTTYTYTSPPAWHYDDNELTLAKYRTWGDWRGYSTVWVQTGPAGFQTSKRYLYFRGMHGDRASAAGGTKSVEIVDSEGHPYDDFERLNGYLREEITYNGAGGPEVTGTINTPWFRQTGTGGGHAATLLDTQYSRTRTRLSDGTNRVAGVNNEFDSYGMPTEVSDLGDVSTGSDDRCTRYTYVRNEDAGVGITNAVSRAEVVSVSCAGTVTRPAQVISDERTYYDQNDSLTDKPTRGLPTKVETMSGWTTGPVYEQRTRIEYDALGRTVKTYDGLTRMTSTVAFTPATGGPVTEKKITDAAGNSKASTLEPAWGSPTVEVDENGKRTDLAYDPSGRLTGVWLPDRPKSSGSTASVSFAYNLSNTAGQPNYVTSRELKPNGEYKTTQSLFDGLLRLRQTQTPGANGAGRVIQDTHYGDRGQVTTQTGPYFEGLSAPTTKIFQPAGLNTLPAVTTYTVDGVDRVTTEVFKVVGSEKWRTTTQYGGDSVSVDPPTGGTPTTTVSDARGNVTELRQFQGPTTSGAYDSTFYTYTPDDKLTTVKNAGNSIWKYTYDLRGRQIQADDPDKGTSMSTYDDADRLVSTKDARGQSLFYDYDILDRKTAVHSGSPTGPVLMSWKYDTLGKNLLTSSTRFVNGNAYESAVTGYDDLNRPTGTRVTIPASEGKLAGVYESATRYNADGSVNQVEMPEVPGLPSETVRSTYGASGNLEAVGGQSSYVVGAQYSSLGDPLRYTMGEVLDNKAAFQNFTYEEGTRRLTSMSVNRQTQTKEDDVFNYTYDPAGNVIATAHSQQQGASTERQCFTYDYLRRMTEARTTSNASCTTAPTTGNLGSVFPYWRNYAYEKSGNRKTVIDHAVAGNTTQTYGYPEANEPRPHAVNSVSSSGPAGTSLDSYTYDGVGNLATRTESGDTDTLTWDAEGHLQKLAGPSGTTDFVYDAEGERLIKHDPTGTTLYLGQTEVRLDKATDTASSTRYYQFNGSTVAMRTSATQVISLMPDYHGTATVSIDATSDQLVRRWMDPFGVPRGEDAAWKSDQRGFVDGKLDDSTGLTHLGAREYDPKLGKFISVDPLVDIKDPQTLNAYAYSNSNPATFSDPTGLMRMPEHYGSPIDPPTPPGPPPADGSGDNNSDVDPQVTDPAEAGIQEEVTRHARAVEEVKEELRHVLKDLTKIVADELGITDALDCFKNGDISSCVATGVTVLTSFAGGVAGKLLSKYAAPWKWKKAAELVGNLKGIAERGVTAVKKLLSFGGGCNSFVPGTSVLMANGTGKAIDKLQVGDKVQSADPQTGKKTIEPVVATIIGQGAKTLVTISTRIEESNGKVSFSSVVATDGHPFYVPAGNRWVPAEGLRAGDVLQSSTAGIQVAVVATMVRRAESRAHNLTVRNQHTYFVVAGATSVLVHNCDDGIVYRALAAGEDPSVGLFARDPSAIGVSPLSHVAGKRNSPWISTTKSQSTAFGKYNREGHGVVAIDSRLVGRVEDVSGGPFPSSPRHSAYARRDQEVLLFQHVPSEAIVQHWPGR